MASAQVASVFSSPTLLSAHSLAKYTEHLLSGFTALAKANADMQCKILAEFDLSTIDAQLSETLRQVRYLRNAVQPIMKLPTETLGQIFHYVQPKLKDRRDYPRGHYWDLMNVHRWLAIRLVCKHWNDVVVSTPSLWACTHLQRFQLFLQHSQRVPLTVYCDDRVATGDDFYAYFDAIKTHLPRLRELVVETWLTNPCSRLKDLVFNNPAPELQALVYLVAKSNEPLPLLFRGDTPALKSLALQCHSGFQSVNFKSLTQLHIVGSIALGPLRSFLNSTPLLEDLMITASDKVEISNPSLTGAPLPLISLPKLRKLVFEDTDYVSINCILKHLSLPQNMFLVSRYSTRGQSSTPSLSPLLQDALKPYLTSIDKVLTKLHYYDDKRLTEQRFSLHAAGDSFTMRVDIDFHHPVYNLQINFRSFAAQIAPELLAPAREVWIDRWSPYRSDSHPTSYEKANPGLGVYRKSVFSSCGDLQDQQVTKLFCYGEAYEGWIQGLTPDDDRPHPARMLRELHILTPLPTEPQCLEEMEKMLRARWAAGTPSLAVYLYLPLGGFLEDEISTWKDAFVQWEAWAPTKLEPLAEKVVFIRTQRLPRMEVPSFCTEQSTGYWKWPTMWDN